MRRPGSALVNFGIGNGQICPWHAPVTLWQTNAGRAFPCPTARGLADSHSASPGGSATLPHIEAARRAPQRKRLSQDERTRLSGNGRARFTLFPDRPVLATSRVQVSFRGTYDSYQQRQGQPKLFQDTREPALRQMLTGTEGFRGYMDAQDMAAWSIPIAGQKAGQNNALRWSFRMASNPREPGAHHEPGRSGEAPQMGDVLHYGGDQGALTEFYPGKTGMGAPKKPRQ